MAPILSKPRVHSATVKLLAQRILRGDFPVGSYLPTEPELCTTLAVSRSSLREAVRVLTEKGLVRARPRSGTIVRPRDDWNLLDPDLLTWSAELDLSGDFIANLIEARQTIEPAAARLAAQRATARDLAAIEAAHERMAAAASAEDVESYIEADIDFHACLLRASHNLVFRQLAITVAAALEYSFRVNARHGRRPGESLAQHALVLEHIRMRNPEGAEAALADLLGSVASALKRAEAAESAKAKG